MRVIDTFFSKTSLKVLFFDKKAKKIWLYQKKAVLLQSRLVRRPRLALNLRLAERSIAE